MLITRTTGGTVCGIVGRGHVSPELPLSLCGPLLHLDPGDQSPPDTPGSCWPLPSAQGRLLPACVGQALLTPSPAWAEFKSEDAWDRCLLLEDPQGLGDADKQGLCFSAGFLDTHLVCVIRGPVLLPSPQAGPPSRPLFGARPFLQR